MFARDTTKASGPDPVPPPVHELEAKVMEKLAQYRDIALSHFAQQMAGLDPARRRALQRLARKT